MGQLVYGRHRDRPMQRDIFLVSPSLLFDFQRIAAAVAGPVLGAPADPGSAVVSDRDRDRNRRVRVRIRELQNM